MSKFLKFIVHFVVVCTIIGVLALALPPFFGVTTEIVDKSDKKTNLPMGSVTYAIPQKTEEISAGTPILVRDEEGIYRYNVVTLDLENHTGTVVNSTVSSSEIINVSVKNYVPKIVITIGYLGYLLVATQSLEGMIILGLAVLFLIILYVIAELWKKDTPDTYTEEDLSAGYVKSAKELKREEKAREKRMREEDKEMLRREKARKKEEKKARKLVRTGGFVDEVYEDELEAEEPERTERPANMQAAASEAHELLKKEIAAATADETEELPQKAVKTKTAETAAKPKKTQRKPEEAPKPAEIRKMAIPVLSAAQLADQAKRAGDTPEIVRDGITKVTLFDYSDIIGGETEEDEE